jgi:hypothetical protein
MVTKGNELVTLGVSNAQIVIDAEVNEKDEVKYNQLRFTFSQQSNCALSHEVRIYSVTKDEVLKLAETIKKSAKYFPNN